MTKLTREELDLFLPKYNLAIEYNGIYYHSVEFDPKFETYHQTKYDLCQKEGIPLMHIFEDENHDVWKESLREYILSPESFKISFENEFRTAKSFSIYGRSFISKIEEKV